jgi:hypothetical protein
MQERFQENTGGGPHQLSDWYGIKTEPAVVLTFR